MLFFNYFIGVDRLKIYGKSDKLLNLLELNSVEYDDLETCDQYIVLSCASYTAKKLLVILSEKEIPFDVISRKGLPFMLKRFILRPGLVLGTIFFSIVMIYYGKFVFDIKIEGNERLSDRYITDALSSFGFEVGTYFPDVDFDALSVAIPGKYGDISWIFVNMMGNVARVRVREFDAGTPGGSDNEFPSDLIAVKAGQIYRFEVSSGIVKVNLGETVYPGQILVSGIEKSETLDYEEKSCGRVFAKTSNSYCLSQEENVIEKSMAERRLLSRTIIFLGKEIKVLKRDRQEEVKCDIIEEEHKLTLPDGTELPVLIREIYALEYSEQERILSEDEAHDMLDLQLSNLIGSLGEGTVVLGMNKEYRYDGGVYYCDIRLYCIENIANETRAVREEKDSTEKQ